MKISIHNLNIQSKIGLYGWEKVITQNLIFFIDLHIDNEEEVSSIDTTIDYDLVISKVTEESQEKHHELLECLAQDILKHIVNISEKIQYCKIKIKKKISFTKNLFSTVEKEYNKQGSI